MRSKFSFLKLNSKFISSNCSLIPLAEIVQPALIRLWDLFVDVESFLRLVIAALVRILEALLGQLPIVPIRTIGEIILILVVQRQWEARFVLIHCRGLPVEIASDFGLACEGRVSCGVLVRRRFLEGRGLLSSWWMLLLVAEVMFLGLTIPGPHAILLPVSIPRAFPDIREEIEVDIQFFLKLLNGTLLW